MRSRYLAGFSLAVMACGFVVTLFLPENTWTLLLKGGFEAGLVGGIADWFAVTALFRHPLGIPIPHTSLLLRNKNRIVQSLVSAMENELLNKASIENKLRKMNILKTVSTALTRLLRKKRVRLAILDFATQLIRSLPLEKAVPHVQSGMSAYIRGFDLKPLADQLLTKAMNSGMDERAIDFLLDKAEDWAERPETAYMLGKLASDKLAAVNVRGFMGFAVQAISGFMSEDKLGGILQGMLLSAIRDLHDKDNSYREAIIREVRIQLFQFANDDEKLMRLNNGLAGYFEGEDGASFMLKTLEDVRRFALDKLEEQRLTGGRSLFALYSALLRKANAEADTIARWEGQLSAFIIHLVESNHYRIGQLVKENVDQMDDASLVRMLEDKVGKDLQWIRVNGALCGFVVGLVLSLIQL